MSTRHCGHVSAYCTCPGWLWGWRSWWNEWWLAGETEVPGENRPRRHFVHHNSHLPDPGANPGCLCGKPATNRLSYGAACEWWVKGWWSWMAKRNASGSSGYSSFLTNKFIRELTQVKLVLRGTSTDRWTSCQPTRPGYLIHANIRSISVT
jgi:hypothetical protein